MWRSDWAQSAAGAAGYNLPSARDCLLTDKNRLGFSSHHIIPSTSRAMILSLASTATVAEPAAAAEASSRSSMTGLDSIIISPLQVQGELALGQQQQVN